MKTRPLLLWGMLLLQSLPLFCQSTFDTITPPPNFYINEGPAIKLDGFSFLKNNASTELYVLNKPAYNRFTTLIKNYAAADNELITKLVDENVLLRLDIEQLKINYDELDNIYAQKDSVNQELQENLRKNIVAISTTLGNTQNTLVNANLALEKANEHADDIKKTKAWSEVKSIGGGIAVGLLVGILISN